jgi:hypothetical protein
MVDWLRRRGQHIPPEHESRSQYTALDRIMNILQDKSELCYPWAPVRNPVDKRLTNCFYVGANHHLVALEKAKDWARIRRYQHVLEIEEDVLPRWYKVAR